MKPNLESEAGFRARRDFSNFSFPVASTLIGKRLSQKQMTANLLRKPEVTSQRSVHRKSLFCAGPLAEDFIMGVMTDLKEAPFRLFSTLIGTEFSSGVEGYSWPDMPSTFTNLGIFASSPLKRTHPLQMVSKFAFQAAGSGVYRPLKYITLKVAWALCDMRFRLALIALFLQALYGLWAERPAANARFFQKSIFWLIFVGVVFTFGWIHLNILYTKIHLSLDSK